MPQSLASSPKATGAPASNFLNRTLRSAWKAIAGIARSKSTEIEPDLPATNIPRLKRQIRECVAVRGGEVSARTRAATLGSTYLSLSSEGRRRFLNVLADETKIDTKPVEEAIEALKAATDQQSRQQAERVLRVSLRSPRMTLYRRFTALPQGVKYLVDLRADLLKFRREDSSFNVLEDELKSLLVSWFDVGFLELRRIEWNSPASLLEKLIDYEAVHQVQGWDDLKNRLRTDRRCFAFFHPRMPDEPLIFVWVALVKETSDNIQDLLNTSAPLLEPDAAETAVFYSISNAQAGLKGISFGDFLIKRVVNVLADEFKNLKRFSTLSPIPSFSRWLNKRFDESAATLLSTSECKALKLQLPKNGGSDGLRTLLEDQHWKQDPEKSQALKIPLLRLCATYLLKEKKVSKKGDTLFAEDSVSHFHLSNGARIERLNWLADTSANGMNRYLGIMVNYRYELNQIEQNHERYKSEGVITASSAVRNLVRMN